MGLFHFGEMAARRYKVVDVKTNQIFIWVIYGDYVHITFMYFLKKFISGAHTK